MSARRLVSSPLDDVTAFLLLNLLDLFFAILVNINDILLDLGELTFEARYLVIEPILILLLVG